jgi:thymidylate synthase
VEVLMQFTGYDFGEIHAELLYRLLDCPDHVCSPRGQEIRELIAPTLVLDNPRMRVLSSPARAANYGFAAGEFLWYWQGRDDLEPMVYYNKRMAAFSDDGRTLNSAYGRRLRRDHELGGITQWAACKAALHEDPDSRRAVMTIARPLDFARAARDRSRDVPCTLSLQFLVRDGELHLHVVMRSNDVIWGLANDLFSFTLLQEAMLLDLRESHPEQFGALELGSYFHTAGSMHLYSRHYEMARAVVDEEIVAAAMPPLTSIADLEHLVTHEIALRVGSVGPELEVPDLLAPRGGEAWLLDRLREHRAKRTAEIIAGGAQ